ncbi:hypothetical protein CXF95_19060 [Paraglaciecola sp. MB-3u-78]|nr:hypothetical protein CXF95_19060 [Paraglaciecola sp. MB-3u-78]
MDELVTIIIHLKLDTSQHLLALSRAESNARKRLSLLAISHFLERKNRTQIALNLKVSRRSVNTWVSNYLSDGVAGLGAKKALGRTCPLLINALNL